MYAITRIGHDLTAFERRNCKWTVYLNIPVFEAPARQLAEVRAREVDWVGPHYCPRTDDDKEAQEMHTCPVQFCDVMCIACLQPFCSECNYPLGGYPYQTNLRRKLCFAKMGCRICNLPPGHACIETFYNVAGSGTNHVRTEAWPRQNIERIFYGQAEDNMYKSYCHVANDVARQFRNWADDIPFIDTTASASANTEPQVEPLNET